MRPVSGFRFQNLSLYRMRRLSRELGRCAEAVLAEDQEIRLHDWRILAAVHESPGITGTKAGPRVLLNKMQASRSVNHLIGLGLLGVSASETDGRAAPLHLTKKGTAVLEIASRRMAALEIWALDALTSVEIGLLDSLLSKVEQRVARSDAPDAATLEQVYDTTSARKRAAYLFAERGDAYEASKP